MSGLVKVAARLRVKPVPLLLVRAQIGGEFVLNLTDNHIASDIAQRGIMRGAWKQIVVEALDGSGMVRDAATYDLSDVPEPDAIATVEDDDNKSMLERLDPALGEFMRRTRDRYQRKGWTTRCYFHWRDELDPERIEQLRVELGTEPTEAGTWADGYEPTTAVTLRPGRDPGSAFHGIWGKKR